MLIQKITKQVSLLFLSVCMAVSVSGCSTEVRSEEVSKKQVETVKEQNITVAASNNKVCKVHFIDVGQGDSILIQVGNTYSLIDTGTSSHYAKVNQYLTSHKVRKLKNFIVTHQDADHMGGAYKVINKYPIEKFYTSSGNNNTYAYKNMISALKKKKLKRTNVVAGSKISFGTGSKATVLAPIKGDKVNDSNERSVVIRLNYGKRSFLFTGDTTARIENAMNKGNAINVDVLKASHHGSDTANGILFIKKASPMYSVISVGSKNNYGHPDGNVLRRLEKYTTKKILRTDKQGDILFTTNGSTLSVSTKKNAGGNTGGTDKKTEKTAVKGPIIANKNTKVYHLKTEKNLPLEKNRVYFSSEKAAKEKGYRPCKRCFH